MKNTETATNYSEASYKRGITQALSFAYDFIAGGGSLSDLGRLCDLAMEMRNRREGSGAFLDILMQKFRARSGRSENFKPEVKADAEKTAQNALEP